MKNTRLVSIKTLCKGRVFAIMKISTVHHVHATLIEAHEINTAHNGLKCTAKYKVADLPFVYTVEFWSKHAPVHIDADLVSIRLVDDAPMIYVNKNGKPMLDKDFNVICTRCILVMCPVKERKGDISIYYRGHEPLVVAQRFVNNYLRPCKFGSSHVDLVQF